MKILFTGASGFVGNALAEAFDNSTYDAIGIVRKLHSIKKGYRNILWCEIGNNYFQDLQDILKGVETVVHCAGITNSKNNRNNSMEIFIQTNINGSLNLAREAIKAGVKRFVFISSIKVNGEYTKVGQPYTESSIPSPFDFYSKSKLEAENKLVSLVSASEMELVIIRPPLVYGPGVSGNFGNMVRLVKSGIPLPFGDIFNQRSLVAIDNLVNFIILCADRSKSPNAANQLFLISDDDDVSTTALIARIAEAIQRPNRLFSVSPNIISGFVYAFGKYNSVNGLFRNLQVDITKAKTLLNWKPTVSMGEQLSKFL